MSCLTTYAHVHDAKVEKVPKDIKISTTLPAGQSEVFQ